MNTAEKYIHDKFFIGNNEREVKIITETMMPHMKAMALEFFLKGLRFFTPDNSLNEQGVKMFTEGFENIWNADVQPLENPDFKGFNSTGLQG